MEEGVIKVPAAIVALAREVGYPPAEAQRQYVSWKKRGLSDDSIKNLIRKYADEKKDRGVGQGKLESTELDEEKKDRKDIAGIIHDKVGVKLGDATLKQLKDSKAWYIEKLKEYQRESFFREFLRMFQMKLDLLNAEINSRKSLDEAALASQTQAFVKHLRDNSGNHGWRTLNSCAL